MSAHVQKQRVRAQTFGISGCLSSLFFCGSCMPRGVIWKKHFKGRGESKCFAKACWHGGFMLLFHLCSAHSSHSSHLSDVNMSVRQPSPKTSPRPSRASSSSSRPFTQTTSLAHMVPASSTLAPYGAPPAGVMNLGQLVGVCGLGS